jgi:hypothetical protein
MVPVEPSLRKLGEGATEAELLDAYPHLTADDIHAAAPYAAAAWRMKNCSLVRLESDGVAQARAGMARQGMNSCMRDWTPFLAHSRS